MSPDTGEIRELNSAQERAVAKQDGFIELPEHLNRAARRALAQGRNPISLTSGGKLARWARQQRRL